MQCQCQCNPDSFPFFCERHQCRKTEKWHGLCRNRPDYFELWEQGTGPGQAIPHSMRPSPGITKAEHAERLIEKIADRRARLEKKNDKLNRPIRLRTIQSIHAIVRDHCTSCEWFQRGTCYRLLGCAKSTEHVSLLVSTAGRCPDGRF